MSDARPPAQIDGCYVLAFASELADLPFTDALHLNVDGEWLGRVPRLAICEWNQRPILGFLAGPMRWALFFELVAIAVVSGAVLQVLGIWRARRRSTQRSPL